MKMIEGGVCAAKGFKAGAIHAGIRRKKGKSDLAMICSDVICSAAGVFTRNKVKASPILLDLEHLKNGQAQAIICNSGNANACAPFGMENARRQAKAAARALGIAEENVLVSSTGVIGQTLNVQAIEDHAADIEMKYDNSEAAAVAIMTTDTKPKSCAVEFEAGGKTCRIGGICKGSGMIHINMGTMLCFITTDCAISAEMLHKALKENVRTTVNRVSVDGDTSTNDSCMILANGLAGNACIESEGADFDAFSAALHEILVDLAKKIAGDGEGCTRLMTVNVSGVSDEDKAETLAMSICSSSLTKAAMFGADANWGRVLCAMGYSGADFDPEKVNVAFASKVGTIAVCENGRGLDFDEDLAKKILSEDSVEINVTMDEGDASVTCWGCDLTYDYVKINGDYRT